MSLWRQIKYGMRALIQRESADREIDEEAEHYLSQLAAEFEAKGLSEDEATRAARMELGSRSNIREHVRDAGWESVVMGAINDCRYAVRRLSRNPTFAVAAVLTLALGIGAAGAIFAVVDGVLLRPLPYPGSDRLIALWHTAPGINLKDMKMSPSLYFTYREESRVFEDIALWSAGRTTVSGTRDPAEEVPTLFVTHTFLNVLGIQPAKGRGFTASDDDGQSVLTVIISDAYSKQRFGATAAALGQRIVIDGNAHEVIGVLPPSFEFLDQKVALVVPKRLRREAVVLIDFGDDGIARLNPGVTLDQANADIARCLLLAPLKFPMNPGFAKDALDNAKVSPTLRFLKDHLVGDIGTTLWVLTGAVGILLLIACANVANLLLVRADGRQQELAVRAALGASWGRLARDLLAESLVLGIVGGTLGLALCFGTLRWLANSGVPNLPRVSSISVEPNTLVFTFLISIATGILFGLIPVWKYARPHRRDTLRASAGRSKTQSKERRAAQRVLLVVQIGLAMVLLVGSGLMIRTFLALRSVDPGFSRPQEVQAVRVSIPPSQAQAPEAVFRLQEAILHKFAAVPGVTHAAITNSVPMEGTASNPVTVENQATADGKVPPVRRMRYVSPGFVAALGSRFVVGRDFTWDELYNHGSIALVSENMARELWGSPQAALGKRMRSLFNNDWQEVVGVVADLRDDGMAKSAPTTVYWPLMLKVASGGVRVPRSVDLLIRTPRAGSEQFVRELRQALQAVNANLPLANVRTLGSIYERSMARTAFALALLGVAGAMAFLLSIVGVYGVIAYSVTQRTRDIGIRIALGSLPLGVIRAFVREGLILAGIGSALGLLAAYALTRWMGSLLFGVSPLDPVTYAGVLVLLVLAALAASWLPARRAALVDPIEALRAE